MDKDYYISDLDGTLLNNQGLLSDYSLQALWSFYKNGLNFTIATGRAYSSMRQAMADSLDPKVPVISFDGALISPFATAEPLYLKEIDSSLAKELVTLLRHEDFYVFLDILKDKQTHFLFENYGNEASLMFIERWKNKQAFANLRQVALLGPYLQEKVVSLALVHTHEKISQVKEKLNLAFSEAPVRFDQEKAPSFMGESVDILWILAKQANKQTALRELASLQTKKLRQMSFFGDNTNDIGVFSLKEVRKIAVANAIKPILERADLVIGDNESDSVAHFIEEEQGLKSYS